MAQLLLKDLRITRTLILLGVAFIGFVFFALGAVEGVPLAVPAVIFGHFMTVTASKLDEKNNNGMMLASLPVTRHELVTSKYASLLMFMAMGFSVTAIWRLLGALVLPARELPAFGLTPTFIILTGIALFYMLYMPLYFGLGAKIAQMLDVIVMLVMAGLGLAFMRILDWMNVDVIERLRSATSASNTNMLALSLLGAAVLLLAVSWRLAVYLYERRQF